MDSPKFNPNVFNFDLELQILERSGDRNPGSLQPLTVLNFATSNAQNTKSSHFRWNSRTRPLEIRSTTVISGLVIAGILFYKSEKRRSLYVLGDVQACLAARKGANNKLTEIRRRTKFGFDYFWCP